MLKRGKQIQRSGFEYMMFIYTHRFQIKAFVEGVIKLFKQFSQAVMSIRISFSKPVDDTKSNEKQL